MSALAGGILKCSPKHTEVHSYEMRRDFLLSDFVGLDATEALPLGAAVLDWSEGDYYAFDMSVTWRTRA